MSKLTNIKPLAIAIGASLAVGSLSAQADENPFGMSSLSSGYMVAGHEEGHDAEGKCGEGKDAEGKCGEGKKDAEGKCGEDKAGEGSCGEGKEDAEGKCGEGKCGK